MSKKNQKSLYVSQVTMTWSIYQSSIRMTTDQRRNRILRTVIFLCALCGDIFLMNYQKIIGFSFLIAAVLLPIILKEIWKRRIKKDYNQTALVKNALISYAFYKDHFEIDNGISIHSVPYKKLDAILEGKKYFYLLLSPKKVYPVMKKKGLTAFLRKYSQNSSGLISEKAAVILLISAMIMMSAYAVINCYKPAEDLLRYLLSNLYCLSIVIGAIAAFLFAIAFNQSDWLKSLQKRKSILARALSIIFVLLLTSVLGILFLYNIFDRISIAKQNNGTYIVETEVYKVDGPFYLRPYK